MFLLSTLRSLQTATRLHIAPPVLGVASVVSRSEEPTVQLPPVNGRYRSRRPAVEAVNRNSIAATRRSSARKAVGL